jgi:hypothetical protein
LQVLLVTGGYDGLSAYLSSTELMAHPAVTGWREAAALPSARWGIRGATIGAGLHVTGGNLGPEEAAVLVWDPVAEGWAAAGELAAVRWYHAVTGIPRAAVADFCTHSSVK